MRKIFKLRGCVILLAMFLFANSLSVFAVPVSAETGYVEYATAASINFEEIIEVTLTEKETGHYYTHFLYRENDYAANKAVPFGTYTITTRVVTDQEETITGYDVVSSPEEVTVTASTLAVPISLQVEIYNSIDLSEEEPKTSSSIIEEMEHSESSEITEGSEENDVTSSQEVVEDSGESTEEEKEDVSSVSSGAFASTDWGSLIVSVLIHAGIFAIAAGVIILIRNRNG